MFSGYAIGHLPGGYAIGHLPGGYAIGHLPGGYAIGHLPGVCHRLGGGGGGGGRRVYAKVTYQGYMPKVTYWGML